MSRILITGGSGFIGREIGRLAIIEGHDVRSLSRSGRPAVAEPWVDEIEWIAADLFEPDRWRDHLNGCDAVIHTISITHESPTQGVTFERMIGDSTILAGLEAERATVSAFVFLSISSPVPFISDRYLTAKRRAERTIADLDVRTSVLRPGPVYAEEPKHGHLPRPVYRLFQVIDNHEWLACRFGYLRPLGVTAVASVTLQAAVTSDAPTLLEIDDIRAQTTAPLRSRHEPAQQTAEES